MTYTNEDSLKVTENEDGSICIEWDPNDPRYLFLNDMTEQQIHDYITSALEQIVKQEENESVQ